MNSKIPIFIGLTVTVIYLLVNLFIINDYGVTWDFTYHFNAGLWHLKKPLTVPGFTMFSWGPLTDLLPTLGLILFSEKIHLLAWDSAYNLYGLLIGVLGIGILFYFAYKLIDFKTALVASLTLALMPRYFGHLHNNMKDIPQAVFFCLSLILFWKLTKRQNLKNLLMAILAVAYAFNTKFNAFFVLIIAFIWLFPVFLNPAGGIKKNKYLLFFFLLSPLVSYIVWSLFWTNPWERLLDAYHSATTTTINMPVLYFGKIYQSGYNIPWHYPFGMFLATSPAVISIFFLFGLFSILRHANNRNLQLVALWFIIPISIFLLPRMIVIDDIRHFMEVIFPFSLISALGFWEFISLVTKHKTIGKKNAAGLTWGVLIIYIVYLAFQTAKSHPYQTSYFSEIVGGTAGAEGKFDIDFWASSYKETAKYLNKNALPSSKIITAMAPDIFKLYLRDDLARNLNRDNVTYGNEDYYQSGDYTVVLNRQSFFNWYGLNSYMTANKPIFTINSNSVPLVYVYKNY